MLLFRPNWPASGPLCNSLSTIQQGYVSKFYLLYLYISSTLCLWTLLWMPFNFYYSYCVLSINWLFLFSWNWKKLLPNVYSKFGVVRSLCLNKKILFDFSIAARNSNSDWRIRFRVSHAGVFLKDSISRVFPESLKRGRKGVNLMEDCYEVLLVYPMAKK